VKRVQARLLTLGSTYSGLELLNPSGLPAPSRPDFPQDSGSGKFRPRLQRRGRPRFPRGSLL